MKSLILSLPDDTELFVVMDGGIKLKVALDGNACVSSCFDQNGKLSLVAYTKNPDNQLKLESQLSPEPLQDPIRLDHLLDAVSKQSPPKDCALAVMVAKDFKYVNDFFIDPMNRVVTLYTKEAPLNQESPMPTAPAYFRSNPGTESYWKDDPPVGSAVEALGQIRDIVSGLDDALPKTNVQCGKCGGQQNIAGIVEHTFNCPEKRKQAAG